MAGDKSLIPQNAPFKHQFRPFHQNEVLLLQSILAELIHAHQLISTLLSTIVTHPKKEIIQPLLMQLAGAGNQYMRLFKWNDDGVMAKLKNFGTLIAQHASEDTSHFCESLTQDTYRAWLIGLELLDTANVKFEEQALIIGLINKLLTTIKRLTRNAGNLILYFKDNENVLFYLVRNREKLDALAGTQFVSQLCSNMFPNGLSGVKQFLIERYQNRGFQHLIPAITTYCSP